MNRTVGPSKRRQRAAAGGRFQHADATSCPRPRCVRRPPLRWFDRRHCLGRDLAPFAVHLVLGQRRGGHGPKRVETHVQRHARDRHAAGRSGAPSSSSREVQAGRRRGHGAGFSAKTVW